jgi:hypothetical protein
MNSHYVKWTILIILFLALIVRAVNLGAHDVVGDESPNAMRAYGLVDYLAATDRQSTPVSWFPEKVWWQGLSFHDAPPLVLWVQYVFLNIFGTSVPATRLSFLLVGVLCVYATFLLAKKLWSPQAGLIAASAMALMNYAVWASRMQFLDGYVALWVILSLYFFISAREKPINYLWWGLSFGAGVLTKYTFLFMGPVFAIALFVSHRSAWRDKWFYAGLAAVLIAISPIVIYNIMMWQTRGHLDAALSTLVGAHPEDFKGLTRAAGKNFDFIGVINSVIGSNLTPGFQILLWLGLGILLYARPALGYLIPLGFLWGLTMLTVVGNHDRFGLAILPFLPLFIGYGVYWVFNNVVPRLRSGSAYFLRISKGCVIILVIWEFFFAIQSNLMPEPLINHKFFLDQSRPHFGVYNDLENYVSRFYKDHPEPSSIIMFTAEPQLAKYQEKRIKRIFAKNPGAPAQTHLMVFDDRIDWFAFTWIFERRRLYDSAPIHSITQFTEKLSQFGPVYYTQLGLKDVTLIVATDYALASEPIRNALSTNVLREIEKNYHPIEEIRDRKGEVAFRIYGLPLN